MVPPKKMPLDCKEVPKPLKSDAPAEKKEETKSDAAAVRKPPAHPSRVLMIKEAIKSLDSYIKQTYPSLDPVQLKHLVRNSLKKGLEKDSSVRPADSTVTAGAMAKFRLGPEVKKSKVENTDPNVKKAPKAAEDEPKPKKGGIDLSSAKSEDERVPISNVKKAPQKTAEGGSAAATFATAAA
uniref:H15 domain-containing protein n=1 Tax=Salarias fasciatus TaxID=181472 RepID=A0A672IS89_SALFA